MKIEKINDNQIRCTLTREDLENHQIRISELAYGTEKAKKLFRDMMQQASYEFGFEAEDIPLMIEAIPLSGDCIVLIITKVEDPDELDTRFSKFSPEVDGSDSDHDIDSAIAAATEGADDVIDLFKRLHAGKLAATEKKQDDSISADNSPDLEVTVPVDLSRMYCFRSLDDVIRLSRVLKEFYQGQNTLYKRMDSSEFILVTSKSEHTPEDFNKICNIMSEYARVIKFSKAAEAYLAEHAQIILSGNALQNLSLM